MKDVTKEELLRAISDGVKDFCLDKFAAYQPIDKMDILEAIEMGTKKAILELKKGKGKK